MPTIKDLQQRTQAGAPKIISLLRDPKVSTAMATIASKHLSADRLLHLAVNAVSSNTRLAQCDPKSVLGAFMTSAALGLEPNTVLQQAFVIPYKKRVYQDGEWQDVYVVQYQIGYKGFVTLFNRSPGVLSVDAEAIREGDTFEHMKGSHAFLKYQKSLQNRGDIIGAYCFTAHSGGVEQATVLPLDEILKIRDRSETYKTLVRRVEEAQNDKAREQAERKLAETPWVMWSDTMAAKSAIKAHARTIALGDATISAATEIDSGSEQNRINLEAMVTPDAVRSVVIDGGQAPEQSAPVSSEPATKQSEPVSTETYSAPKQQPPTEKEPEAPRKHSESAPHWPKRVRSNDELPRWIDSAGETFDAEKHGWNVKLKMPTVKDDGTFRARRRSKKTTEPTEPAETAQGFSDVE